MDLSKIRRHLHQNPELSGKEYQSANYIEKQLKEAGFIDFNRIAETGILIKIEGEQPGTVSLFRFDIDALPIEDRIEKSYKSVHPGIGHKCGHDGHTAIGIGFSLYVFKKPPVRGTVFVLFQPAEETGQGAANVLKDISERGISLDFAFALHNIPGIPRHTIQIKRGHFTSEVISCLIRFTGVTSHAATPWKGSLTSSFMVEVLKFINELNGSSDKNSTGQVISLIHTEIGERSYGTTGTDGNAGFTLRAPSPELMEILKRKFIDLVNLSAERSRLSLEWSWFESFPSIINDDEALDTVARVASNIGLDINEFSHNHNWGEDFGYFSDHAKCCMFGLGAGEDILPLHHPEYDFPDEIISTGVSIFSAIKDEIHNT